MANEGKIKPFKEFLEDVSKGKMDTLTPHAATQGKAAQA